MKHNHGRMRRGKLVHQLAAAVRRAVVDQPNGQERRRVVQCQQRCKQSGQAADFVAQRHQNQDMAQIQAAFWLPESRTEQIIGSRQQEGKAAQVKEQQEGAS